MKNKISLSTPVKSYPGDLTNESAIKDGLSPQLQQLVGIVKLPSDFDEHRELAPYFENKHLR